MAEPFLAEIRMAGFSFPPQGWALCDGQILPIEQNQSLFALLGTAFGGDGRTSFALPDLRGRTPIHVASGHPQGQRDGEESVTLTEAEIPSHTHTMQASTDTGTSFVPVGNVFASGLAIYSAAQNLSASGDTKLSNTGGSQGHNNMQPYQVVSFIIALQGTFPPRN